MSADNQTDAALLLLTAIIALATFVSPTIAVQIQGWLERKRQSDRQKMAIFERLMATRGARLSIEHITSLNLIDLAFNGQMRRTWPLPWTKRHVQTARERLVCEAWRNYHNLLGPRSNDAWDAENNTRNEAFISLLSAISYERELQFDVEVLRTGEYYPRGYVDNETASQRNQKSLASVLTGETPIHVVVLSASNSAERPG